MENSVILNTGNEMPILGLGTSGITDEAVMTKMIEDGTGIGYRLIDTASSYKNENLVGKAIRECGIPREDLFIQTKLWNTAQRIGNIESAFERSLERLGTSYVDLYLVHWPVPGCTLETWRAMEEIYESGRARAIGVCNFNEVQLTELLEHADVVPAVNQIEYHPLLNQDSLRRFCQKNGITVEAHTPLAKGAYLEKEVLKTMAERHFRSISQIGLRWLVQKGCAVLPKTTQLTHLIANSQIFDFSLDDQEMQLIDSLNENLRVSSLPEDLQS